MNFESAIDRKLAAVAIGYLLLVSVNGMHGEWTMLVGLSIAATFLLYPLWRRDKVATAQVVTMTQVLWGALLLRLLFLPIFPCLTDEIYRYIWDGWLQMEGLNPYQYAPEHDALSDFKFASGNDAASRYQLSPLYKRLDSPSFVSVDPPLAQLFFAVGGWFQSIDWRGSYFVLKGLVTAVEFGGVLVLSRLISKRNLLLYAWNPLVLIAVAGQGHTEGLLVFCIVGLVWAVQRGWGRVASLAVAAAGLVSLYPFVLWPFLLRRFGWTAVWPGVVLGIGVSLPYAAPYALPNITASIDLLSQLSDYNAGVYLAVTALAESVTGQEWSAVIRTIFRYTFLAALPVLYYLDWRQKWSFARSALVTVGLFLLLSTTIHPWYFLPVLILGVLSERPAWPWFWIAAFSIGTYQLYLDRPYWLSVYVAWSGGAVLTLWMYRAQLRALLSPLPAWVANSYRYVNRSLPSVLSPR